MSTLSYKLFRDLKNTLGQVLAIAFVIAGGAATFIMSLGTLDSLQATRHLYYQQYNFADIFASVKRAPENVGRRIAEIPGVSALQTRVVAPVKLAISGFDDPVKGQIISVPDSDEPRLNKLYLRQGRQLDPNRSDEVLMNEAIAKAHNFSLGDSIQAVIKGRLKTLTIVGIVLSPETIYQLAPGAIVPDFKRYGVLWMSRRFLEASFEMEGAFNDVVVSLSAGASADDVIDRINLMLAPYGGIDAYGREWQTSHRFLNEEFKQLKQMSTMFSSIFLGVAAFLLNVVIKRLIDTQREQIAVLKAFGYRNREIAFHYIAYVLCIVSIGLCLGAGAGIWLGKGLSNLYMEYYHFPFLEYQLHPSRIITAALVSGSAAVLGTVFAVRTAVSLAPAEAMQAESPATYRESLVERLGLKRWLSQPNRMIVRHIERRPMKASLSTLGIALSCAIMVVGTFFKDAVDFMVDIEFRLSQHQDATVIFTEPSARRTLYELISMPGIEYAEGFRAVAVRLKYQHRHYRTAIQGFEHNRQLHQILDQNLEPIELPESGMMITDQLSKMLNVQVGDKLTVEVLEGRQPKLQIPVVGLISQYIGVAAYMNLSALNTIMKEGDIISGVHLKIDKRQQQAVYDRFKNIPRIANTDVRENVINNFKETVTKFMLTYVAFISLLAGIITFGVIYNIARIALSERGRELASMRVLGFTQGEIAYILLGELGLLTLIAIPLGLFLGYGLSVYLVSSFQHELFRIPLVIEAHTYALATIVVLIAAVFSGLLVMLRLYNLDLVSALKTKE